MTQLALGLKKAFYVGEGENIFYTVCIYLRCAHRFTRFT